ncbi:hypothetical protein UZ36_05595 [Candidatus Nitromaritima sp. SCGC AAA799-C22]|nr:hypothetical protein UZ36_05595 [Candidatus Nitromaritima sp. SCGC AAA799-C22]
MKEQEIIDLMDDIPFFDGFAKAQKEKLAKIKSHIVNFEKGDYVIHQGEVDSTIFVLLKGELIITKNDAPEAELNTLPKGAIFGEVPLITGLPRSTNVIAKYEAVVLKMDGYMFDNLDPAILGKFKDHLLKVLIRRLDQMNNAMANLKTEFDKIYRRT